VEDLRVQALERYILEIMHAKKIPGQRLQYLNMEKQFIRMDLAF
jgi:hypothetical protein